MIKSSFTIRLAGLATLIPILAHSTFAGSLDAYVGLKRLIVASSPSGPAAEKAAATLVRSSVQLEERDVKVIDVSENSHRISAALRFSREKTATIRKDLNLKAGETRPVFILIGKDGGEKARSYDTLEVEKWITLIDGMPMRQAEIQEQEKSK